MHKQIINFCGLWVSDECTILMASCASIYFDLFQTQNRNLTRLLKRLRIVLYFYPDTKIWFIKF